MFINDILKMHGAWGYGTNARTSTKRAVATPCRDEEAKVPKVGKSDELRRPEQYRAITGTGRKNIQSQRDGRSD